MDHLLTKIIVVAVILLLITAFVVPRVRGRRVSTKRVAAMAAVARREGWRFTEEDQSLVPVVQHLPAATGTPTDYVLSKALRGEPRRLAVGSRTWNMLDGEVEGRHVRVFDWTAGQGSGGGKASLVYLHTVWAIELTGVERWVQAASTSQPFDEWRPGRWVRTGDDAFDKRFRVTCGDAGGLMTGLGVQTRHLLLESGFDGWRLDSDLQMLVLWTYSRRAFTPAAQVVPMTQQAVRLAAEAADARTGRA